MDRSPPDRAGGRCVRNCRPPGRAGLSLPIRVPTADAVGSMLARAVRAFDQLPLNNFLLGHYRNPGLLALQPTLTTAFLENTLLVDRLAMSAQASGARTTARRRYS
jgi:hypothetical protein